MKPIVEVTWLDAQDNPETWVDAKAAEDFTNIDCKVTSVGYLVHKTPKYVTIGGDYDEADDNYGCVRKIPTNVVLNIREL